MLCVNCGSLEEELSTCSRCGSVLNPAGMMPPAGAPMMQQAVYPGFVPGMQAPMYAPYASMPQPIHVPETPPTPAPPGDYAIQGVVVAPPTEIEMLAPFDYGQLLSVPIRMAVRFFVTSIFLVTMFLFSPFIILFSRGRSGSPFRSRERIPYLKLRVLETNGVQREALLPVDSRGPGISWGDYVSLQGKEHRGVVMVNAGYNHVLGRPIHVRSMLGYKIQLVSNFLLIAVVIYYLAYWGVFSALFRALMHSH